MPKPTPGVTVTEADRDERQAWVDENPLRAWRHAQPKRVSILEAAERIGVGMSMVQMYERGVHKPGQKSADRLAKLLGDDWSKRWDVWLANRPVD